MRVNFPLFGGERPVFSSDLSPAQRSETRTGASDRDPVLAATERFADAAMASAYPKAAERTLADLQLNYDMYYAPDALLRASAPTMHDALAVAAMAGRGAGERVEIVFDGSDSPVEDPGNNFARDNLAYAAYDGGVRQYNSGNYAVIDPAAQPAAIDHDNYVSGIAAAPEIPGMPTMPTDVPSVAEAAAVATRMQADSRLAIEQAYVNRGVQ